MRLMMALACGRRNRRGFGLPGWGSGVTVPISMKPKPSAASPSMQSPFLSSPAARPTGFGKGQSHHGARFVRYAFRDDAAQTQCMRANSGRRSVTWCAVSGSSRNNAGRNNGYMASTSQGVRLFHVGRLRPSMLHAPVLSPSMHQEGSGQVCRMCAICRPASLAQAGIAFCMPSCGCL